MICKFADDLATQAGIKLSRVSVVEGRRVGCLDAYLLNLVSDGQLVSALMYQSELDELHSDSCCERLESKIRTALSRLQVSQEP